VGSLHLFPDCQLLTGRVCVNCLQLLNTALNNPEQAKFLVQLKIEEFRGFGGVSSFSTLLKMSLNNIPEEIMFNFVYFSPSYLKNRFHFLEFFIIFSFFLFIYYLSHIYIL